MKLKKLKKFISGLCLFLVIVFAIGSTQDVLVSRSNIDAQFIPSFYEERENSLDAVYIGSSNCYAFWNSALAFKQYGICVYPYSTNGQPFYAAKYLIEEARKTQKDALYIVNINTVFDDTVPTDHFHNLINVMPNSLTKLHMINHLCEMGEYSLEDRWEYYFPIVRFHSRWEKLKAKDFEKVPSTTKGATATYLYLNIIRDVAKNYVTSDKEAKLPEKVVKSTNELLDYCEKEKIKVLFVTAPQAVADTARVERYNALNKLIRDRGFDTLDLMDKVEEVGIDLKVDYYNGEHTNIHGSFKFTDYLSRYIVDKYDLKDKRGDENYADWQAALDEYREIADVKALPYEYDTDLRAYDLNMYKPTLEVEGKTIKISWDEVEGADGYTIYRRKKKANKWKEFASVKGTSKIDTDVTIGKGYTYYYSVAPYIIKDGKKYYGDTYYNGKKIKT